jgi:hypothetical protein
VGGALLSSSLGKLPGRSCPVIRYGSRLNRNLLAHPKRIEHSTDWVMWSPRKRHRAGVEPMAPWF